MYEPEAESDEDCEVYFLKPVNEYNIVDKIKEANKELFALDDDDDDHVGVAVDDKDATTTASSRKVTFALNLENYEPTAQQQQQQLEQETQLPSPPDELLQQLAQLKLKPDRERFATIVEEPAKELEKIAEQPPKEIEVELEEEEICEEILELTEVEVNGSSSNNNSSNGQQLASTVSAASMDYDDDVDDDNENENDDDDDDFSGVDEDDLTAAPETLANETQKRRISRQNTFDCNYEQTEGESDQRSLTNLLTESDCEEDERAVNEARLKLRHAYKSLYKSLDANEQAQLNRLTSHGNEVADVEEDDDLSIIAANYIPDDFELNERSIYYKKDDETQQQQQQQKLQTSSPIGSNTISSTSTKTFFNSRRFSFRRRARATPSSVSSSSTTAAPEIKMNYKICCEHRHALQDKLPKYTGYMSEYGLSVKQLQQRDQQLRRKQRFSMEQTLNRNEHELKKMQDNERAFTTWLKNKMRYPINKTRNMFDTTRRRASVAAVNSPSPHKHQKHQQHSQQQQMNRRRDSIEVHPYRHLLGSWNK